MEGGQIEKHYELDTSDPQSSFFEFHLTLFICYIKRLHYIIYQSYCVHLLHMFNIICCVQCAGLR